MQYSLTGPQPLPTRVHRRMRFNPSCFNFQYSLVSLRSSNSCLRLLPRPPSLLTSIFPSVTCFRRQFLRKMWRIQSAFLHFTARRIFLSSFNPRHINLTERTNTMQPCSRIYYSKVCYFWRHTAHHRELKNCNCSLWFYIRFWLPAAAMAIAAAGNQKLM